MNKADKIIYNIADYNSRDELLNEALRQMRIFMENHKVFSFNEIPQNKGYYLLQFGSSEITEDSLWPVWLDNDEILHVAQFNNQVDYAQAKKLVDEFENGDDWNDVIISPGKKNTPPGNSGKGGGKDGDA